MKKILLLVIILLAVSLSLFGNGKGEYRGNSEESYFYRFRIDDPGHAANNKIFVSERVMKPGFDKYKKIKKNGLTLFPLFNLDIYALEGNVRKNIKDFEVSVPITISKEFIEKTTHQEVYNLYVYLQNKKEWVPIGSSESGIVDVVVTSETFEFTIINWPVDDRMIASGR